EVLVRPTARPISRMDGEYPCSRTQSPMNRTIPRCRAVSVGSRSGPPDAWSAVMLLMSPLRRAGPSPDDVMLHVNAEKQNPVLEPAGCGQRLRREHPARPERPQEAATDVMAARLGPRGGRPAGRPG